MNITKKNLRYFFLNRCNSTSKIKSNKIITHFNSQNKYHINYCTNLNKTFNKNFNNNKASYKKPLTKINNKILEHIVEKDEKEKNDKAPLNDLDILVDFDTDKNNDSIVYSSKSFTLSSKDIKNSVKYIVNKFNHNKSATTLFFNKEKKMELNSLSNITNSSLGLLLAEENENVSTVNNEDKSNSLPSKMIDLFNNRTQRYLNSSQSSLKMFSSKTDQFRLELINSFKNIGNSKELIKKLKRKYNESVDIFERQTDMKIKKAVQDEKSFYKLKNEENEKNINLIYKKLLLLSKQRSEDRKLTYFSKGKSSRKSLNIKQNSIKLIKLKRNSVVENKFLFNNDTSKDKSKENISNFSSSLELINLKQNPRITKYKRLYKCKNEEKVEKAHLQYAKFKINKIRQNAKKFRDIIGEMINSSYRLKKSTYLDDESKKIRIINNNLMKISKMQKINKSIDKFEFDEFKEEYSKLKEKMNKCENEYYRVSVFNNKYKLSFLRPTLKQSTIKKYIQMNNYAFGFPC